MSNEYKKIVYEFLFYLDKEWGFDGPTQYFCGTLVHYSDFMKAKSGSL